MLQAFESPISISLRTDTQIVLTFITSFELIVWINFVW